VGVILDQAAITVAYTVFEIKPATHPRIRLCVGCCGGGLVEAWIEGHTEPWSITLGGRVDEYTARRAVGLYLASKGKREVYIG
jgi:hypothetical protein